MLIDRSFLDAQLEEKVRESEKEIGEKKEKIEELDSQVSLMSES